MRIKLCVAVLASLLVTSVALPARAAVSCDDAASCSAAIAALQAKYKQSQRRVTQSKQAASEYQSALQELQAKLTATQHNINQTKKQVGSVADQIDTLTEAITKESDHLTVLRGSISDSMRALYVASQRSTLEIFLSSATLGEAQADMQRVQTIQDDMQRSVQETKQLEADLQQKKNDLQQRKDDLVSLNDTLTSHKKDLSVQTTQTNSLLNATQAQVKQYVADQTQIKQQIAETQRKLATLTNEAHWGTGIVSAAPASWMYIQLNYPETMGRSPYTVHDYGCFVTSIAMVSSFYGHRVSPAQIANNDAYFDRHGYAYVESIANGLGLSIKDRGPIDWGTVDGELVAGHPVIVSIYLPGVGAINQDGSSHFIVLQAKTGSTYLMQDPLGPGRSYDLKYIRSMILLAS